MSRWASPARTSFALAPLGLPERDGTIASVVRSDAGSLSSNCPNIGSYTIEPTLASLASTVSALTPPATGNNYTSGPCSHPGNLVNTCAYAVADPSTVVTAVDQKLTSLQQGYYDDVLTQMGSSSEIADAVTALNGARALVDDYTALALPVALASDPTLRSVVYGPNDLLDDSSPGDQLQAFFQNAYNNPPATDPAAPGGDARNRHEAGGARIRSCGQGGPWSRTGLFRAGAPGKAGCGCGWRQRRR